MEKKWYIDAWCIRDGMAFGSFREAGSIEADATIYVCPPYFEPEAVGSIATGLAATRGAFQAGFFSSADDEETEISFDSVDELVEYVRREFLGGGADYEPESNVVPLLPIDGGDVPGTLFELPDSDKAWDAFQIALMRRGQTEEAQGELGLAISKFLDGHDQQWLRGYLLSTFRSFATWPEDESVGGNLVATLSAWASLMRQYGIRVAPEKGGIYRIQAGDGHSFVRPSTTSAQILFHRALPAESNWSSDAIIPDFLHRVPLPIRYSDLKWEKYGRMPPAPSLGGMLCMASADRIYLESIQSPAQMFPLCVAALIEVMTCQPRWRSSEMTNSARAGKWLSRQLPSSAPDEHPAEEEINRMMRRRMKQFRKRLSSGTGSASSGSAGPGPGEIVTGYPNVKQYQETDSDQPKPTRYL